MKVTQKHFELFRGYCRLFIDALSLNDYQWEFRLEDLGDETTWAKVKTSYSPKQCYISLNKKIEIWSDLSFEDELKATAFHEVFEASLIRIQIMAENRDNKDDIESERHAIVHRLWNMIERSDICE